MTDTTAWIAAALTVAISVGYELVLMQMQRRNPATLAWSTHANLREEWFAALSQQPVSEILAVQTLRNSLMSATMTASTAALGLIGAATLLVPSLNSSFGTLDNMARHFSAREATARLFQSGWFVVGLLTQTLIVHMIRTPKLAFIESRAAWPLLGMTLAVMAIGIFLPIGPFAGYFKLVPLPLAYFGWLAAILVSYALLTRLMKRYYVRRYGWQ